MNISLPESLEAFVDEQVSLHGYGYGYGYGSEYVCELIRRDQDRLQMRHRLLAGASSAPTAPVSDAYFDGLRERVRSAGKSRRKT